LPPKKLVYYSIQFTEKGPLASLVWWLLLDKAVHRQSIPMSINCLQQEPRPCII